MRILLPAMERQLLSEEATLLPGHLTYEQWKDPQVDLYKDFYFFNLTNPEQFQSGAELPNVTEVGPYRYREVRRKTPGSPTGSGGSFSGNTHLPYTQTKLYFFEPSGNLSEDDTVYTLNFPLISAVAVIEHTSNPLERDALREVLKGIFLYEKSKLWIKAKVHDVIWNYTDPFMQFLHKVQPKLLPKPYIQIQVNDSADDRKTSIVMTGTDDIKNLCQFVQWDGNMTLSIWKGSATKLHGTEGLFFHPLLDKEENLYAFVDDVKRSFKLNHTEDVSILDMSAYRYRVDYKEFLSAKDYPPNADYGSYGPTGTVYLGPVQIPVVPVYGSKPHFLDGDPSLTKNVIGMHPVRSKHDTVVDVEPITGATLNVARQLQINFQVNQSSHYSQLEHIRGTDGVLYYPLFYVNEHGTVNQNLKNQIESAALIPLAGITDGGWALTGVLGLLGVVLLSGSLCCCVGSLRMWRKTRGHGRERGRVNDATPLLS